MLFFLPFVIFFIIIYYIFFSSGNTILEPKINDEPKTNDDPKINNNAKKIIVWFRGEEYDISDFVRKHPGGKQILLENNGKDIEHLMLENEHSLNAYNILEKYKIKR